jgi:hypothetical protein
MQQKQVAILESRMGAQLSALVAGRGGVPFHAPALAELPDLDHQAIGALVQSLETRPAKLAIFQPRMQRAQICGECSHVVVILPGVIDQCFPGQVTPGPGQVKRMLKQMLRSDVGVDDVQVIVHSVMEWPVRL